MIDPALLRTCTVELCDSQRRRGKTTECVIEAVALDQLIVYKKHLCERVSNEINSVQRDVASRLETSQDAAELLLRKRALTEQKLDLSREVSEMQATLASKMSEIGNLVDPRVVDGAVNVVLREWDPDRAPGASLPHREIMASLDMGAKIAGHRGYFLKNWGVRLNLALVTYSLDFLAGRGYTLVHTPLATKDDTEPPLSAFYARECLSTASLPLRCAGYSTCARGERVEQFCIADPERSDAMFDEMMHTAEDFYKSLELPYRVVSVVAGELSEAARIDLTS